MPYPTHLIPTTVVGSYPQPAWLVDRDALKGRVVPRTKAPELWRIAAPLLEGAQDDATILAIRDMERAGIDIVTDGEARRESYSNRFAVALDGIDGDNPAEIIGRTGANTIVPRVVGPIRRLAPVELRDAKFLRANTHKPTKITLPGPFTMSMQAKDDYYKDPEAVAMAYAVAVNEELHDLKAAGMDVVQLDEPWMQARPEQATAFGVKVLNRALQGISGPITVHLCFGYAVVVNDKPSGYSFLPQLADSLATQISIEAAQPKLDLGVLKELGDKSVLLGVLDLGRITPETPEEVAALARQALKFLPAERLILAPDCGMKYLSRELAFAKLEAMVKGAAIVRKELAG